MPVWPELVRQAAGMASGFLKNRAGCSGNPDGAAGERVGTAGEAVFGQPEKTVSQNGKPALD